MKRALRTGVALLGVLALMGCDEDDHLVGIGRNGDAVPALGAIQGSVTAAGTPVGATWVVLVQLRDSVLTDGAGRFVFDHLPAATYSVSLKAPPEYRLAPGYSSTQRVTVTPGRTGRVAWQLSPPGHLR